MQFEPVAFRLGAFQTELEEEGVGVRELCGHHRGLDVRRVP